MWTEERIDELRRLWREGISCGIIAKRFETTRNSVIGKVHRLNLPARKTLVKQARQLDRRPSYRQRITPRLAVKRSGNGHHTYVHKRKSQEAPVIPVPVVLPEPESLNLTIMDLKPGQCRWAHGDGPFLFCGVPTGGDTYCPHHHGRAVKPEPVTRATRRRDERLVKLQELYL